MRILIVEDDPGISGGLLSSLLRAAGSHGVKRPARRQSLRAGQILRERLALAQAQRFGTEGPDGKPQNLGIGLTLVERIAGMHRAAGEPPMPTRFSIVWPADALC